MSPTPRLLDLGADRPTLPPLPPAADATLPPPDPDNTDLRRCREQALENDRAARIEGAPPRMDKPPPP